MAPRINGRLSRESSRERAIQWAAAPPRPSIHSDRQLSFNLAASDVSAGPGLYPISVTNKFSASMAAVNLAVQPPVSFTPTPLAGSPITVGASPSSVAIDTATGIAVIANQGTQITGGGGHDVTLIDLKQSPPARLGFICTELVGAALSTPEPTCPGVGPAERPGPASVAIDNLRNLALVANSGNNTLAVIDLTSRTVTALLTFPSADPNGNPFPLTPQAVGINPVSGRALVAFTSNISGSGPGGSNAGAILDMNQLQTTVGSVALPPAVINVVNLNNGVNPHIAVSPRLNWAIATPGGAGSLSVVDLGRQITNTITSLSRTSNVVAANTSVAPSLQVGQPVLVTGIADTTFDGIFSVTAVSNAGFQYERIGPNGTSGGGITSYAQPVASLATNLNVRGVSINDETQKALLVDPTSTVPAFVFHILDQTSALVQGLPSATNYVATAMNPLTNIGVIVNKGSGTASVIDPTAPAVIGSPFTTGTSPVDVAIDPATNTAVIVNQGDNSVSLFSLGALRSAPQIAQSSFSPSGPAQSSSHVTINSSLGSAGVAAKSDRDAHREIPGSGSFLPRSTGIPPPSRASRFQMAVGS